MIGSWKAPHVHRFIAQRNLVWVGIFPLQQIRTKCIFILLSKVSIFYQGTEENYEYAFPWTITLHIRHKYRTQSVHDCIVFIHFYSTSQGTSLSEALPTTAIDTVFEFTHRSATGNCKWRTRNPLVKRHRLYQCATTPHSDIYRHVESSNM